MKLIILLLLSLVLQTAIAETTTSGTRGGGDLCENRIKIIRDDLVDWISKGGPSTLKLPNEISVGQYTNDMMNVLSTTAVECVGKGDHGHPVEINGVSKVCVFDSGKNNIVCDFNKFTNTNESDQYVLIHHEYAGLANIEIPNVSDSNYSVSNQISGYLIDLVIKKLAVKPHLQSIEGFDRFVTLGKGEIFKLSEVMKLDNTECEAQGEEGVDFIKTFDGLECLSSTCKYDVSFTEIILINNLELIQKVWGTELNEFKGKIKNIDCKNDKLDRNENDYWNASLLKGFNSVSKGEITQETDTFCYELEVQLSYNDSNMRITRFLFDKKRVACPKR